MIPAPRMISLKHIPVRHNIEVAREQRVVGVGPDVPGVGGRDFRVEVVGVTEDDAGGVGLEQGGVQGLRDLRHAGDGFAGEVFVVGR